MTTLTPLQHPVTTAHAVGDESATSHSIDSVLLQIEGRLKGLESTLGQVLERVSKKEVVKEYYTTSEVATLLGKRPYTVREWCRLGRVHATRTHAGRGEVEEWRVSHEELVRIQNEGLLPLKRR